MIDEARDSAGVIAERKQQEAIAAAEQIMAKAREASALEHERTMRQLKRELGRLVVDTTAKVTGKVLTPTISGASRRKQPVRSHPNQRTKRVKISKEMRQLSRNLVRASFVNGPLDRDRIRDRPRHHRKETAQLPRLLKNYQRLLRLEVDKKRASRSKPRPSSTRTPAGRFWRT